MQSGKNDLRRLDQRLRPHRHALRYGQTVAHRLHGRRGQGRHRADARRRGLHRQDFTTAPDGKLYQLPDQQFANLYWFRADWFARPDLKEKFKAKYGYDLGVPLNWTAYEDIADFFTNDVKEIDGVKVYGHMDYGKKDPSLGWRFTDAWLSMAGDADKGIPNGLPVDEWGIRVEAARRSAPRSRAAATPTRRPRSTRSTKYIDWMKKYAPPEAAGMTFCEAGPVPAQGKIAQQIFWYTAFTADMVKPGLPVVNADGTPKWRMAPVAARPVLEGGHAERLPGRRLVDAAEVDARSSAARRPGSTCSSSSRRRCR